MESTIIRLLDKYQETEELILKRKIDLNNLKFKIEYMESEEISAGLEGSNEAIRKANLFLKMKEYYEEKIALENKILELLNLSNSFYQELKVYKLFYARKDEQ